MSIPNWPVLQTLWGAPYGSNGGTPSGYLPVGSAGFNYYGFTGQNVDISNRILTALNIKDGKQYELDTAQAGELTTTIRNDDAVLDPTNASSPFAGHIAPYQPISVVAQYPESVNLLTAFQAKSGQSWSPGTIPSGYNVYSGSDPTNLGSMVAQAGAPGGMAFSFAVPAATGADVFVMAFTNTPCTPNGQYTFSTNVMNVTAGVTGQVQIAFGWYGPNFSYGPASWSYGPDVHISPNTWYGISATATAPPWACGVAVGIVTGAALASAYNVEVYNSQFQAGGLSAYQIPGASYPMFSGWIERWPTKWKAGGQYGTLSATVVDAMALLSQGQLSDPLTEEITAAGSRFLYRLDDPSSQDQAYEAWGRLPALTPSSVGLAGTLTFGNAITAANPVTGIFSAGGTSPSVVDIAPTSAGTAYLDLTTAGIYGPATNTSFTRMIAFRWTGTINATGQAVYLWSAADHSQVNQCSLVLVANGTTNSAGAQLGFYLGASGLVYSPINSVNLLDGNWHLVGFGTNGASTIMFVDGQYYANAGVYVAPTNVVNDQIGWLGNNTTPYNSVYFQGSISYAAEFPTMLSHAEVSNLYSAWLNACSGESSSARYNRILRYAGYTGPTSVGYGALTTSMGPATDMAGSDALTCLENVITTENGTHWIAGDGTLTMLGRAARYNRATPQFVFGENTAAGEWPYEDLQLDYDTTHLANDVTVTNNANGQVFSAVNTASQLAYFDRTMSRTVNVSNPQEAQDAANFLAWRYSQPLTRVSSMTLNPAAVAGMWPVALTLSIGDCIQINRRPPGCPMISLLVWVEARQWTLDEDGNAKLVLQCSPAIQTPMAQFTDFQATLYQSISPGANTAVITNATDMVNPLNAQLSPGMQFEIHSFAATTFETLTIKTVQSTGSNWTTGTLTFTTNFANSHAAGSPASEITDSSNLNLHNTNAVFDSVAFAY